MTSKHTSNSNSSTLSFDHLTLKLLGTFLLILFFTHTCFAQPSFQKTYGGTALDYGPSSLLNNAGEIVFSGGAGSFGAGSNDMTLRNVDLSGNLQWSRAYGGSGNDPNNVVIQTSDNGYLLGGGTMSYGSGSFDMYLVKTDVSGNLQWSRSIGGSGFEQVYDVIELSSGGYLCTGITNSFGSGSTDVYVARLNASGTVLWSRTYGGTGSEGSYGIIHLSNGNYLISGYTNSFGAGGIDMMLLEIDANGTQQNVYYVGGTGNDYGYKCIESTSGEYAISGFTTSYGAGGNDFFFVKIDAAGSLDFARTYGGTNNDAAGFNFVPNGSGGFAICGYTRSYGFGLNDIMLVNVDANGAPIWTKVYGGADQDYGYGIASVPGGYVMSGNCRSFGSGNYDAILIKTDSFGYSGPSCNESDITVGTSTVTPTISIVASIPTTTGGSITSPTSTTTVTSPTTTQLCFTVLPIELVYFDATCLDENSALIQWSTSSELNNDFFTIEYSTDGIEWTAIARIEGAGTTLAHSNYEYVHSASKIAGYYRLKQTDFDDKSSYSHVSTAMCSATNELQVYPIPSNDFVTIESSELSKNALEVYNAQGKTISLHDKILDRSMDQITMDVSLLPKGLYIARLGNKHVKFIVVGE